MREVWESLQTWRQAGIPAALATVVRVNGSALRTQGAKMAISADGQIAGSVTGGCVEGVVFEEAQAVLKSGAPKWLTFGGSEAAEWDVGLICGGSIQVFVESLRSEAWQTVYPRVQEALDGKSPAVLATVLDGEQAGNKLILTADGQRCGDLGTEALNETAAGYRVATGTEQEPASILVPTPAGETNIFIEFLWPRPRLIIVGAVHLAIPLAALAKTMNFHTTVVDARSVFAAAARFPQVDELIVAWPGETLAKMGLNQSDCVVCLSHDPKLDNPALLAALNSPAGYIGALGSRGTHAKRLAALGAEGMREEELKRIHGPIGLDLGARQPEEIALSILAEIVKERYSTPADHSTQWLCPVSETS